MVLQASGAISFSQIAAEFGDTAPHSMTEFYAGGTRVPASVAGVPASGAITLSTFLGKANTISISSATGSNSIYYGVPVTYTGAGYIEFTSNASSVPIINAMTNYNYFFMSSTANNITKRVNLYSSTTVAGSSNYRVSFTPSTTTYPANTFYTMYFTSNVYMSTGTTNYWFHRTADDQARTTNDINSADKLTYVWSLAGSILSTYPGYHLFRSQRDVNKYIRHAGEVMWFNATPTNYDFPYQPQLQSDHTIRFRNPWNLTYWVGLDATDTTRLRMRNGGTQYWNMNMVDSYLTELVAVVSNITASTVKTTSITLTWTTNATYVNITWTGGGSANNISATTYTFSGLTPGTSYTFNITPFLNNASGTVGTLTTSTASSITVGTLSSSKLSTTSILISWNTGTYDYVIITWANGGSSGQQTGSSYQVSGLTANTQYTFTVTPYNTLNNSGTAQTLVVTTASSLSGGTLSASSVLGNSMTISWNGTSYHYVILTWTPGNGSSGQLSATTYNVTGLTINTSYTFTLTPYSFDNVAGTTSTLVQSTSASVLDTLSASAKSSIRGVYSFKYLYSGYSGPVFTVRRSSDNATKDFYGDSQGNLTDISSQTFASWASTDTIYVTNWYDQSGLGNHASQTNTSLQPLLVNASKTLNFRTSRYLNLPNATLPAANSNYTITIKHGVIDGTCLIGSGNYSTTSGSLALEKSGTTAYNNFWWANDIIFSTYTPSNVVTIKYNNTVGRTCYVNGTSTATDSVTNRNSFATNNAIGTDFRNGTSGSTLNGDMYFALIFNSPLSDADRQICESV